MVAYDIDRNLEFEHVFFSKKSILSKIEGKNSNNDSETRNQLIGQAIVESISLSKDYTTQQSIFLKSITSNKTICQFMQTNLLFA